MINIPDVTVQTNAKKPYGQEAGGFKLGMNTVELTSGLQVFQGAFIENGELKKMAGDSELAELEAEEIIKVGEYEKSDGTFQRICVIQEDLVWKIRAIEDDGTEVIPSVDIGFTSDVFGWSQISLTGYISNKVEASTSQNLFSWDGASLTAVTNCPDFPQWISRIGRRLITGTEGVTSLSRADENPITSWTGGQDQFTELEFRTTLSGQPTGSVDSGTGSIVAFRNGLELHDIIVQSDGTGNQFVNDETRNKTFTYTGRGIDSPEKITMGEFSCYIINEDGLVVIDPLRGTAKNLSSDESGKIGRYWKLFDLSNAVLRYSSKEKMIVASVNTTDTGINDLLVCYHEPTESFSFRLGNYKSLEVVNGQLHGGSSIDGKLGKVFDDGKFTNIYGEKLTVRIISEWDTITNVSDQKVPLDLFPFLSADDSEFVTLNIYTDGDVDEPVASFTFTVEDLTDTGSITAAYGRYVMGVGRPDEDSTSDLLGKQDLDVPFYYYCWEIIHESSGDFKLRDFITEYFSNGEIEATKPFPNALFSL